MATNFASVQDLQENENNKKQPLLIKISFKGSKQYFYLNSRDYSAYPEEEEILLQDGVKYSVIKRYDQQVNIKSGKYKIKKTLTVVELENIPEKYSGMNKFAKFFNLYFQ